MAKLATILIAVTLIFLALIWPVIVFYNPTGLVLLPIWWISLEITGRRAVKNEYFKIKLKSIILYEKEKP